MPVVVPIFLDVDGVLNSNWWDVKDGKINADVNSEGVDPLLLQNLADLVAKLEVQGYTPRIVISSTWRLEASSMTRLLRQLSRATLQGERRPLDMYIYGCDRVDDLKDGVTPDLHDRTSVDCRAAEILTWLQQHPHEFYLILDDLNLLFKDDGTVNTGILSVHFVHTVDERNEQKGPVGLTPDRVELALQKISEQRLKLKREQQTGEFTEEEWALLKGSGLPLDILRKDTCPFWIKDAARQRVKAARGGSAKPCCIL